jgi:hypothetical protein
MERERDGMDIKYLRMLEKRALWFGLFFCVGAGIIVAAWSDMVLEEKIAALKVENELLWKRAEVLQMRLERTGLFVQGDTIKVEVDGVDKSGQELTFVDIDGGKNE